MCILQEVAMKLVRIAFSIVVAAVAACATAVTLSPNRLASSEAAIRTAGELGAQGVPQAALHLRLAEEEMNQAKSFADQGNAERADLYLRRSNADAELAVALIKEARARGEADRAKANADALEGSTR